jgi:hypothetical protein
MSRSARVLVVAVLLLLGALAVPFLGGRIQACLGSLGVAAVQCAQATGVVPDVGIGLPFLALMISLAIFVIGPGARPPALRIGQARFGAGGVSVVTRAGRVSQGPAADRRSVTTAPDLA